MSVPFKMMSFKGGAVVFGMSSNRNLSYAKPPVCHTQNPSSTAVMTETNVPPPAEIKKKRASLNATVQKLNQVQLKKPKRKPIDF